MLLLVVHYECSNGSKLRSTVIYTINHNDVLLINTYFFMHSTVADPEPRTLSVQSFARYPHVCIGFNWVQGSLKKKPSRCKCVWYPVIGVLCSWFYSWLQPSVPMIFSISPATLIRIKHLLKMNQRMFVGFFSYFHFPALGFSDSNWESRKWLWGTDS